MSRDLAALLRELRRKSPRQAEKTLRRLRLTEDERRALLELAERGPHRTIPGTRRLAEDEHQALTEALKEGR